MERREISCYYCRERLRLILSGPHPNVRGPLGIVESGRFEVDLIGHFPSKMLKCTHRAKSCMPIPARGQPAQ